MPKVRAVCAVAVDRLPAKLDGNPEPERSITLGTSDNRGSALPAPQLILFAAIHQWPLCLASNSRSPRRFLFVRRRFALRGTLQIGEVAREILGQFGMLQGVFDGGLEVAQLGAAVIALALILVGEHLLFA